MDSMETSTPKTDAPNVDAGLAHATPGLNCRRAVTAVVAAAAFFRITFVEETPSAIPAVNSTQMVRDKRRYTYTLGTIRTHFRSSNSSNPSSGTDIGIIRDQEDTLDGLSGDDYENIITKRSNAEKLWARQSGNLWMQHSRKAGGTNLCMTLRLNSRGLIKPDARHWESAVAQRKTCQICSLCCDCNIREKPGYSVEKLPNMVQRAMEAAGQNFIEFEGNGVPTDLLTNSAWDNWVFVSSMRHPLDRIISSLKHDPLFRRQCNRGDLLCALKYVGNEETVLERCRHGIYYCFSNYYVRMFSGLDNQYTNDDEMMQLAKKNFVRFSCVPLVEQWDATVSCFERVNLYLRTDKQFNVGGQIGKISNMQEHNSSVHLLPEEKRTQFEHMNKADLEFYAWAKDVIVTEANGI